MKIQGICALASAANSVSATIKESSDSLARRSKLAVYSPTPSMMAPQKVQAPSLML
jgi:hypothetical protein